LEKESRILGGGDFGKKLKRGFEGSRDAISCVDSGRGAQTNFKKIKKRTLLLEKAVVLRRRTF